MKDIIHFNFLFSLLLLLPLTNQSYNLDKILIPTPKLILLGRKVKKRNMHIIVLISSIITK